MADIKQAAKWLDERRKVRRAKWQEGRSLLLDDGGFVIWERTGTDFLCTVTNMLADDWEIAE